MGQSQCWCELNDDIFCNMNGHTLGLILKGEAEKLLASSVSEYKFMVEDASDHVCECVLLWSGLEPSQAGNGSFPNTTPDRKSRSR